MDCLKVALFMVWSSIFNIQYGKCPKISNTLFHTFIGLNFAFYTGFRKILSGMANNVDPDWTAPELAA